MNRVVAAVCRDRVVGTAINPQRVPCRRFLVWTQPVGLEVIAFLGRRPLLVVDGAHNADSAKNLGIALGQYFDFDDLILIIGTSADKDMSGIAAELAPLADTVIATRSRHPRASDPLSIAGEFSRLGVQAEVADDIAQALVKARQKATNRSLICATGSLFLVGEVIENVKGLHPEVYPQ